MKKTFLVLILTITCLLGLSINALAAERFDDVSPQDWFYGDLMFAVDNGLVNGKTATTYQPNADLSIAEAVKLAASLHQLNAEGLVSLMAANNGAWYQPFVDYAYQQGIISEEYLWTKSINRGQFMDIFYRALPAEQLAAINTVPTDAIPDTAEASQYGAAIYGLYRAGIVQGSDEAKNALPMTNIKRSEVATILARMVDPNRRVSFVIEAVSPTAPTAPSDSDFAISMHPQSTDIFYGEDGELSIKVGGGSEPYYYQWQQSINDDWVDLVDGSYWISTEGGDSVSGSQTATLKLISGDYLGNGKFRCLVEDVQGNMLISEEVFVNIISY